MSERAPKQPLSFRTADGLRLAADATGDPACPPVVLLHGGGQTRHSWHGTADRLAAAGWWAICVDLRGHGESDWSPEGDYTHVSFSGDALEIARSLDRPPVLVGASLGGISSLLAIDRAREQGTPLASGLVLVDIATRMEFEGAKRIMGFMAQKPEGFASLEQAADAIHAYNPHRPRPKDLAGLAKNLRERDGRFHWHWDPKFIQGRSFEHGPSERIHDADLLDRAAAHLRLPTLLVRGRLSDLLSEAGARAFLEQVPHARFADVSGAGHMVAGDRNDVFAQAVIDFLDSEVRPTLAGG